MHHYDEVNDDDGLFVDSEVCSGNSLPRMRAHCAPEEAQYFHCGGFSRDESSFGLRLMKHVLQGRSKLAHQHSLSDTETISVAAIQHGKTLVLVKHEGRVVLFSSRVREHHIVMLDDDHCVVYSQRATLQAPCGDCGRVRDVPFHLETS
jgi:hypothetical protein